MSWFRRLTSRLLCRAHTGAWLWACVALCGENVHGLAPQPERFTGKAADPTHNLTPAEFLRDLGGNFRGLLSAENMVPVHVVAGAYSLATIPEQRIERHFAPGNVWKNWDIAGKYIGHPLILGGVSATLFAASRDSADRRFRSFSYSLLQGTIVSSSIVQPTKRIVHRLRPNSEDHHSFPSGHVTDSFMYATVAAEHYGWKAAVPGYTVATYVAATRMADQKHHITDAVVGAGLGYLIGKTVSRRTKNDAFSKVSVSAFRTNRGFGAVVRIGLP